MTSEKTATAFFHACESGKGWEVCREYCHTGATFSAQSGAIADTDTLEGYCEWMKGLLTILPDGSYDLKSTGVDEANDKIMFFSVFSGTHTAEGGPVPPTGKKAEADYVYVADMKDGKVAHLTKIWNDGWTLQQLGWA